MSIWSELKELSNTKEELKKFGLTTGAVFSAMGGFLLWRGRHHGVYFLAAGAFLLFFGLFFPILLRPIRTAMAAVSITLGWILPRVALAITFYLVITPIGFIIRLKRNDILNLRFKDGKDSYWVPRVPREKSGYTKQF